MSSAALALKVQHIPLSVGLVLKMAVQFTWTETLIENLLYSSPEQKNSEYLLYSSPEQKHSLYQLNISPEQKHSLYLLYCKVHLNKNSFFISVEQNRNFHYIFYTVRPDTWMETFIICMNCLDRKNTDWAWYIYTVTDKFPRISKYLEDASGATWLTGKIFLIIQNASACS
jgi:hypothetical protein